MLHPLWAPVHPRRADGTDVRGPVRRTHVLHPSTPPRRGPRPGRRPRPVVPFDIPIEAFAVEVGGGAHPSVRSLGDRRLVYVEHRQAMRRTYRRRQLVFAAGLSGAFVAVAVAALAPGTHAAASASGRVEHASVAGAKAAVAISDPPATGSVSASASAAVPAKPPFGLAHARHGTSDRWSGGLPGASTFGSAGPAPVFSRRSGPDGWGPPVTAAPSRGPSLADDPFLVCTRGYESIDAGGYAAISPYGRYFGAYQFDLLTWNATARHLQRFDLVGVRPDHARPSDQDLLAYTLYKWQGASHWNYRCAGLP